MKPFNRRLPTLSLLPLLALVFSGSASAESFEFHCGWNEGLPIGASATVDGTIEMTPTSKGKTLVAGKYDVALRSGRTTILRNEGILFQGEAKLATPMVFEITSEEPRLSARIDIEFLNASSIEYDGNTYLMDCTDGEGTSIE